MCRWRLSLNVTRVIEGVTHREERQNTGIARPNRSETVYSIRWYNQRVVGTNLVNLVAQPYLQRAFQYHDKLVGGVPMQRCANANPDSASRTMPL